jgi:hypothetical protein
MERNLLALAHSTLLMCGYTLGYFLRGETVGHTPYCLTTLVHLGSQLGFSASLTCSFVWVPGINLEQPLTWVLRDAQADVVSLLKFV